MKISRNISTERENNTQGQHQPKTMIFEDGLNIDNVESASDENLRWAKKQFSIFRHVIVISCISGFILTAAALLIILCNRKFRTIPNFFHVNLFISNLCIMATGLVFEFPVLLVGKWPFADSACQINLPVRRMFFSITLAHFGLMALNRLFAICLTKRRCLVSKTAFIIMSLLGYGVPALAFVFNYMVDPMKGNKIVYNEQLETCVLVAHDIEHVRHRRILLSTLSGVLPILPSIVCYTCILIKVRRMRIELHNFNDPGATISGHLAARHLRQELYIAKTAAATFCFYALTVTVPNVSYGLISKDGMPKFLNIVGMAWIGIALQPVIFFATNRKFRAHTTAIMCCKDPPDGDTTGSLRRRSTRTSSSVSRPSRISFADLRVLFGVLPQGIRDKAFLKERSPNKSNDNLQTVSEVREPMVLSSNL